MKKITISLLIICSLNSCVFDLAPEPELVTDFDFILQGFTSLTEAQQKIINGVYKVTFDNNKKWSKNVVCKYVNNRLCIYSNEDVVFSENIGGFQKDSIKYTGKVRVVRSGEGWTHTLVISKSDGADYIIENKNPSKLKINAFDKIGICFTLEKVGELVEPKNFLVIAHRGGCRNSERIGISENSLEMMEYAEILGADGIEIDVKRTRDNKLIIFHDETFSPRTVQGAYLLGQVTSFTYNQISTFGRLIYGEKIPTLDEALQTIIDKTNLKLVWLDTKDENQITIDEIINAQVKYSRIAQERGRSLSILMGIPNDTVLNRYDQVAKGKLEKTELLIELEDADLNTYSNCKVWAPRWTLDIESNKNIPYVKSNGIKIFRWTVDLETSITNYLKYRNSNYTPINGILSNYPTLVTAIKYTSELKN